MTEVRARAARHKGQLNFEADLRNFLFAFGDDHEPLPETVRVLDELVTDFIIETCHMAARSASYSNRQKIKVDDFKFAIRNNEAMLGRVQELFALEKHLKKYRHEHFADIAEGKANLEKGAARLVGEEGGRRRGRKPRNAQASDDDNE